MAGPLFEHPYYPIIYVRGYAGTDSDIEDTVSDPYMGCLLYTSDAADE